VRARRVNRLERYKGKDALYSGESCSIKSVPFSVLTENLNVLDY
jgi:hypothetical protein